jgi:hypothetical protein
MGHAKGRRKRERPACGPACGRAPVPGQRGLCWASITGPPPRARHVACLCTSRTPCVERVYNALPPESRQGRVQLLVPDGHSAGVLHLAATGDHGWSRRLRLGKPMLQQASAAAEPAAGPTAWARRVTRSFMPRDHAPCPRTPQGVATMVHESPFYGARCAPLLDGAEASRANRARSTNPWRRRTRRRWARRWACAQPAVWSPSSASVLPPPCPCACGAVARRPAEQRGSKLRHVSDLLTLGWATIIESL